MSQIGSRVIQPGEGESYWQPVPANGFVEIALAQHRDTGLGFDAGIQEVAPGAHVRRHAHEVNEELILVLDGHGTAELDGNEHVMQPGSILHLVPGSPHSFHNGHEREPLRFYFVLLPGGLREFFAAIGRPRRAADPVPDPFPRPGDVAAIEARTVFAAPQQDKDQGERDG